MIFNFIIFKMNAFDYFMSYYNCSTREELSGKIKNFGSDLPIPPHRCAHPKQKIFNNITEIKILDFVPTTRDNHLICLCTPKTFEYSFNFNDSLFEDGTIYDEFFLSTSRRYNYLSSEGKRVHV